MDKPTVFLGSSSKALDILDVVQRGIQDIAEPMPWKDEMEVGAMTLIEQLFSTAARADFAILVFNADDQIEKDGKSHAVTRDNVLFECGLFMGQLGRERTYVIAPKGLDLPDDLKGILYAEYDPESRNNNKDRLATSLTRIKRTIQKYGPRHSRLEKEVRSLRSELDDVGFLLLNFLTDAEKNHLRYLADDDRPFSYVLRDSFKAELSRLTQLGLIDRNEGLHGFRSAWKDTGPNNDLKNHFHITDKGRDFLKRLDTLTNGEP